MPIQVTNLREITSALRQLDDKAGERMKGEFRAIAEAVASAARDKVPHLTGAAAASIRPRGSQRGAAIAFGGNAAPYMPWLDFGGSTGKGHRPGVADSGSVKRPWLGKPGGDGRYIYPTIEEKRSELEKRVEGAIMRTAASLQLETD